MKDFAQAYQLPTIRFSNDDEISFQRLKAAQKRFIAVRDVVPCFSPGTMIATPEGERPVEKLRVGDRVVTRDNGFQKIRWIGSKHISAVKLLNMPELRPVLIREGALALEQPCRDILLSPTHRVLARRLAAMSSEGEALVAASFFERSPGAATLDVLGITYIHIMFEYHQVILSNGLWTESFHPGKHSLNAIGKAQRAEILSLFPELEEEEGSSGFAPVRPLFGEEIGGSG